MEFAREATVLRGSSFTKETQTDLNLRAGNVELRCAVLKYPEEIVTSGLR
jgi:hypothetical protein